MAMTNEQRLEKRRAYARKYYAEHRDKVQGWQRAYRAKYPARYKLAAQIYQTEHLEQARQANIRHRDKQQAAVRQLRADNAAVRQAAITAGLDSYVCTMADGSKRRFGI